MSVTCPVCRAAFRTSRADGSEHRSGPVRVVVEPRDAQRCTPGCPGPDDALAAALGDATSVGLLVATGPTRSRHCGDCDGPLDLPMRATSRSLTVAPEGTAPFTVTLDLPVVRCGECGRDNVPGELSMGLTRSIRRACGLSTAEQPDRATGWFRRLRRRAGPGSLAGP